MSESKSEEDVSIPEKEFSQSPFNHSGDALNSSGPGLDRDAEKHSRNSSVNSNTPTLPLQLNDPPDGGLRAWFNVLGAFMLLFNSWGYLNAFGVFQSYYSASLLPDSSPSTISWIGSVQAFLLLFGASFAGRFFDAGYLKHTIIGGGFLLVFCTCMVSLSTKYWQFFLCQALGSGLAMGMMFVPGVACVSTWFKAHRAFALGITASGSSVGAVIFPITLERLIPRIGFPWAVRTVALIQLFGIVLATATMRSRLPPRKAGPLIEIGAFRQPSYTLFTISGFFAFWGLYTPFFYGTAFAEKISTPSNLVPYVLAIMNASSVFGRIIPNILADKVGPINMTVPTVTISAILLFCWLAIHTYPAFIVFCILYGFFSGTLVSLPPACCAVLTDPKDISKMGTRMGMMFAVVSFGTLTGTPIAGALITKDNGGFVFAIIFSGLAILVGGIGLFFTRVLRGGWGLRTRV